MMKLARARARARLFALAVRWRPMLFRLAFAVMLAASLTPGDAHAQYDTSAVGPQGQVLSGRCLTQRTSTGAVALFWCPGTAAGKSLWKDNTGATVFDWNVTTAATFTVSGILTVTGTINGPTFGATAGETLMASAWSRIDNGAVNASSRSVADAAGNYFFSFGNYTVQLSAGDDRYVVKYSPGNGAAAVAAITSRGTFLAGGLSGVGLKAVVNHGTAANAQATEHGFSALVAGAKTITFGSAFAAAPDCFCTDSTAIAACDATAPSTTQITLGGTGTDTVRWFCIGDR